MYCKKCGKFIGNDSDLCDECLANVGEFSKQNVEISQPVVTYPKENYTAKNPEVKLGTAIASIILSFVGLWMVYFGYIFSLASAATGDIIASIFLILIGCVPTILGLVFGITSIINFKATSRVKSGKRIPLLILGIHSVVFAAVAIFILLLLFFVMFVMLTLV